MIRVADEDLSTVQLNALVGQLVKVEYTDSGDIFNPYPDDDYYHDGEIYEEVGVVEDVYIDRESYSVISLRIRHGYLQRLTMLGEDGERLFFTTDLEAQ